MENETLEKETQLPRTVKAGELSIQSDNANAVVAQQLQISKESFTLTPQVINLNEIGFTQPLKQSRITTHPGLSRSVGEYGVLQPVHVRQSASWINHQAQTPDEPFDGIKYVLLDGFRRVYASIKNQETQINAMVWSFNDPNQGEDLHLLLGLLLNRTQDRTANEKWGLYKTIDELYVLTPSNLEFFLGLKPGEAMKLKDIMTCDFPEIIAELIEDQKTIDQAYNLLIRARRDLDEPTLGENHSLSTLAEGEGFGKEVTQMLSDDDVQALLEMKEAEPEELDSPPEDELSDGLSQEQLEELIRTGGAEGFNVQSSQARERLAPALRNAVLIRDSFRCQCCGTGGTAFASTLVIHHIIPVSCGGPDKLDNLVTLCDSDHITLESLAINKLQLHLTPQEVEEIKQDEKTNERLKRVLKYAKIVYQAHVRKKQKVVATPRRKPWENEIKEINEIVQQFAQVKKHDDA